MNSRILSLYIIVDGYFAAIFVGYSNGIGSVFSYHYGAQNHEELKNLRKRSLTRGVGNTAWLHQTVY